MTKTIEEKIASACLKSGITEAAKIEEVQDLYRAGVFGKPEGETKLRKRHIRTFLESKKETRPEWFTGEKIDEKADNPWKSGSLNLTRQMQIYKASPKLAQALCLKATGRPLGAPPLVKK